MGEPSLGESFASAFGFLGDVIFKWVPSVAVTVFDTVNPKSGDSALSLPVEPVSVSDIPGFLQQVSAPGVYESIEYGWYSFVLLSLAFSIPFLAVVVYCWVRIFLLRRHERRVFNAAQHPVATRDIPKTQLRWNRVLEQARDGTEQSWRLAILEADIMLNDLLDMQGYKGETMADKMKQVDRASFNSIDAAWEAHGVRNRIAHDGSEHTLSARETRRIIGLYERILKEFRYIE